MSSRVRKGPFIPKNSDGCTVISKPYIWLTGKYLEQRPCCVKHDEWYHYGGSHAQRLQADRELRECVCECGDNKFERAIFWVVGWVMYFAVRAGGSPKLPFPWRWRNNVPFELEDVKSGYKDTPINYDEERLKDAELLYTIAERQLAVVSSPENTSGIEPIKPDNPTDEEIADVVEDHVEIVDEIVPLVDLKK